MEYGHMDAICISMPCRHNCVPLISMLSSVWYSQYDCPGTAECGRIWLALNNLVRIINIQCLKVCNTLINTVIINVIPSNGAYIPTITTYLQTWYEDKQTWTYNQTMTMTLHFTDTTRTIYSHAQRHEILGLPNIGHSHIHLTFR